MSGYHMTIETPEDASPEERKQIRARGIEQALTDVATDPESRLRMILGEAFQRYGAVWRWLDSEIEKDEAKTPGLKALAEAWAADPSRLIARHSKFMSEAVGVVQQRLLEDAMGVASVPCGTADAPQIEHSLPERKACTCDAPLGGLHKPHCDALPEQYRHLSEEELWEVMRKAQHPLFDEDDDDLNAMDGALMR